MNTPQTDTLICNTLLFLRKHSSFENGPWLTIIFIWKDSVWIFYPNYIHGGSCLFPNILRWLLLLIISLLLKRWAISALHIFGDGSQAFGDLCPACPSSLINLVKRCCCAGEATPRQDHRVGGTRLVPQMSYCPLGKVIDPNLVFYLIKWA